MFSLYYIWSRRLVKHEICWMYNSVVTVKFRNEFMLRAGKKEPAGIRYLEPSSGNLNRLTWTGCETVVFNKICFLFIIVVLYYLRNISSL